MNENRNESRAAAFCAGFIVGILFTVFLAEFGFPGQWADAKAACEANLPRNQECEWQPPRQGHS